MAQLDIKKCTFKIVDGRLATLAIGAGNANVTYTAVSKHLGTRGDLKVAHVTAGMNTALTVAVATASGITTVTVNLATDGGGVATSTALQVKNAVIASGPAAALVTATNSGSGASLAVAAAAAVVNTTPARSVTIKVGTGTVDFTRSKDIMYTLDRGLLDQVKYGDDVPMDLSVDMTWENFEGDVGNTNPSPIDALLQANTASTWTSTDDDPLGCSPYCVDIEVTFDPGSCGGQLREIYTFRTFYWEDMNPTYKDGKISFKGKCNVTDPNIYRLT